MAKDELEKLGGMLRGVIGVKLGSGVVGKSFQGYLAIVGLSAILIVKAPWYVGLYILGAVVVVYGGWFISSMVYANKNPGPAMLEGGHLITFDRNRMAQQGKDGPIEIVPEIVEANPAAKNLPAKESDGA